MRSWSTPKPWFAARASPESLSRMRLKMGVSISFEPTEMLLRRWRSGFPALIGLLRSERDRRARVAYLEARKAAHGDVLAQLADLGSDQLRNVDGLVLDEGLLQQAHLFVELFHL